MNLRVAFRALGDENRINIIRLLKNGEYCVCEIINELKPLTQPAISHHLKILKDSGLVVDRREGKWIYYSLNKSTLLDMNDFLENLMIPGNVQRNPSCDECIR